MKNIDVIEAFLDNNDESVYMSTEHLSFRGNRLWSYNTVIAEKVKGITDRDILMINTTKYSVTTSRHQTYLYRELEFYTSKYQMIEIDNKSIPRGTQHLCNL